MYTIEQIIELLEFKKGLEEAVCESMEGEDNDRQMSFIGGMEYAIDIIKNPENNGINE